MNSFSVEQKRVDVFESAAPNKPVIYIRIPMGAGAQHLSVFDRHRLSGFFAGCSQ